LISNSGRHQSGEVVLATVPHAPASAAGGERRPQVVDLVLHLAAHEQRDRFREPELRAAVQGDEVILCLPGIDLSP
jgi:hypothetical protein